MWEGEPDGVKVRVPVDIALELTDNVFAGVTVRVPVVNEELDKEDNDEPDTDTVNDIQAEVDAVGVGVRPIDAVA